MADRLDIDAAIPILHKESLDDFGFVGRPAHDVILRFGIVIEMHHPRSLLAVRSRDDPIEHLLIKSRRLYISFVVLNL